MKRKIFSVFFALVLALSLSLVTAVPVGAQETLQVVPFTLGYEGDATVEWSIAEKYAGSSSVKLDTGTGTSGDEARIVINASAVGIETLDDIDSISWWVYNLDAGPGYPPHVDIVLDCDGDSILDDEDMLTAEMSYNNADGIELDEELTPSSNSWLQTFELAPGDGYGEIGDSTMLWVTKMGAGNDDAPWGTLANWKGGLVANDPGGDGLAAGVIDSTAPVLRLEIEVDNWVLDSEAYVDNIAINGVVYYGLIQDAIDSADPLDTISVAAGTYTEQVNIEESLTITGSGTSDCNIVCPGAASMTFYDEFGSKGSSIRYSSHRGTNLPIVRIAASDVTFQGFHIDYSGENLLHQQGKEYSRGVGILVDHVETVSGTPDIFTGITIQNNKIDGMLYDKADEGIKVLAQATVSILNNTIYCYGESAISAQGVDSPIRAAFYPTVTANSNTIYGGTNAHLLTVFFGIGYWSGATGSADDNTIYNVPNDSGYALNSWTPNPVSFTNNFIYTDGGAVGGYGAQLFESSNLIFSGNDVQDQELAGAIGGAGTGTDVTITITNNNITNCTDGFSCNRLATGSVTLHYNNFSGIADGHYALDMTHPEIFPFGWSHPGPCTITADATNNWWGDATGPKQATSNPCASGDEVSDNVDYSPWLDAVYLDGSERSYNVKNTDTQETFNSIQAAIDDTDTDADDTINVLMGTYNLTAPIAVTESVTITGNIATPSNVVVNAPTGATDMDCFQVKANNVTIQGFLIQGAKDADVGVGYQNAGVMIGTHWVGAEIVGLQYIDISYNEITDCTRGIYVYRAQDVTISHNKIHHCVIDGPNAANAWPGKGIELRGNGDPTATQCKNIDILENEIYSNALLGIEINLWEMDPSTATEEDVFVDVNVLIDGNEIYSNGGSWDPMVPGQTIRRGISCNGQTTGVTINDNKIYGHIGSTHREAGGIRIEDDKDFTITNNTLYDNDNGIVFSRADYASLSGHVITGNDIYNNGNGISVDDGDVGYAHNNNIYGNSVVGVENLNTTTFDATNNWWKTKDGAVIATMVSGSVDYDPWFGAGVEDSKSEETLAGDQTVVAIAETDTEVFKKGSGTPTITVTEYTANPGGDTPGGFKSAGKYIDVHLDTKEGVDEIVIRNFYTSDDIAGVDEASLRLSWWNGTDWVSCSYSAAEYPLNGDTYIGYVWAIITDDTTPNLTDLAGAAFMAMGAPPAAPPAGGGGFAPPVPTPGSTYVRGVVTTAGVFLTDKIATSEDELCTLTIPKGTVGLTEELERISEITMLIMDEPPPPPEGAHIIGLAYKFQPSGATFEPAITLTWSYDPADIPGGIAEEDLVVAYWDEAAGEWVELEGCVVDPETGTITAPLSHFTTFGIITRVPAPPPPPTPAAFSVTGLSIEPLQVQVGEEVTVTVSVANIGGTEGSYSVVLNINAVKEAEKSATIRAGGTVNVIFSVTREDVGSYDVAVDVMSSSFTVLAPAPPPPPTPVPPTPVVPPAEPINWPVLGAVIAGVVLLGLLGFFLVRRRAH